MASPTPTAIGVARSEHILQQIIDTRPTQPPAVTMHEAAESAEIVEDLRSGTITFVAYVNETPPNAWRNAGLAGLAIGDPHPWYRYLVPSGNAYCIRREFLHHVPRGLDESGAEQAWTKMSLTFQTRPCLGHYEERDTTVLVPQAHWWAVGYQNGDPYWHLLSPTLQGINVPSPNTIYRRRWPNVAINELAVRDLRDSVGSVNGVELFTGVSDEEEYLLESVDSQKLFGGQNSHANELEVWDITLSFRRDPIRRHRLWVPRLSNDNQLITPPIPQNWDDGTQVINAIRSVTDETRTRPLSMKNWNGLVLDSDDARCHPPRPTSGAI